MAELTFEEKLIKYAEINSHIKRLTDAKKQLSKEILEEKSEFKETIGDNNFYTVKRTTYELKEDIDQSTIAKTYPDAIIIDAKKLYKIAEKPYELIKENVTVSLTARGISKKQKEDKKKKDQEIVF